MSDLTAFLDTLRPRLKTALDPTLLAAVRSVLREFCDKSSVWRDDLATIALIAGTASYAVMPPADAEVSALLDARVDGNQVDLTRREDLDHMVGNWKAATGPIRAVWLPSRDTVKCYPIPTTGTSLDLYAALRPTLTATTCPDFLVADWHDAIVAGAQAFLQLQPGMPWTDPAAAELAAAQFAAGLDKATRSRITARSARPQRASLPFFAGV